MVADQELPSLSHVNNGGQVNVTWLAVTCLKKLIPKATTSHMRIMKHRKAKPPQQIHWWQPDTLVSTIIKSLGTGGSMQPLDQLYIMIGLYCPITFMQNTWVAWTLWLVPWIVYTDRMSDIKNTKHQPRAPELQRTNTLSLYWNSMHL